MKTKQSLWTRANRALKFGLASIVAAASVAPTTGCSMSEFNPLFKPNPISSTWKERGLFEFGRKIEAMYDDGQKWTLDDKTNTLYVRGENFAEAVKEFGITEGDTFQDFYHGAQIEVEVLRPVERENGQREFEQVSKRTALVSGEETFGTEFGEFDAATSRSKLDETMTTAVRKVYGNDKIEVVLNETAHPFSGGPASTTFYGLGVVNSSYGAPEVISLNTTPNLQFAALAAPTKDCKYIVVVKGDSNEENLVAEHEKNVQEGEADEGYTFRTDPRFVSRVVVYGETGAFVTGVYNDVDFNHKDYVLGLGNKPLDNFDAFVGRVSTTVNGIVNLTGAYQAGRMNLDFIMNENTYLPSKIAEAAKPSALEKAVERTGQVNTLIGNVKQIPCTLKGDCAGGAQ